VQLFKLVSANLCLQKLLKIAKYNTMTKIILFISLLILVNMNFVSAQDPSASAQYLLFKLKTEESAQHEIDFLSTVSLADLDAHLADESMKKAFWINIYNAFIILKIKENTELFKNKRNQFFTKKWLLIAQQKLSFDDIEHGILRRSKHKYSRGAFNKPFFRISKFEKKFRLDSLDYRIHFALNCGAVSCPPVAFYDAEKIDKQLELAKSNFLRNESKFDEASNTLHVSKIFFWFIRDFGRKKGIVQIHKDLKIIPKYGLPLVRFKDYDWNTIY